MLVANYNVLDQPALERLRAEVDDRFHEPPGAGKRWASRSAGCPWFVSLGYSGSDQVTKFWKLLPGPSRGLLLRDIVPGEADSQSATGSQ